MNAEKMLEMQMQMRENNADLQSFINGLDGWEDEIKEKEKKLLQQEIPASAESKNKTSLPPVRNSLTKKKRRKKVKKATVDETKEAESGSVKPKRIPGFDFKAWDRFDVDKALEEIGSSDEADKSSSSEYETDDEWEAQRRMQQATMYKDQGNTFFKTGDFDKAIECYTQGMASDPSNVLLPANRAMALLKQDKCAAAESDCTLAISLDPTYLKAFSRRGTARLALKKYEGAKGDFTRVLKLDPGNKQAKLELDKIEKILDPPKEPITEDTGIVKAIHKPLEARSKKLLRRVKIEEIGRGVEEEREKEIERVKLQQSAVKQRIEKRDEEDFEQFVSASPQQPRDVGKNTAIIEELKPDMTELELGEDKEIDAETTTAIESPPPSNTGRKAVQISALDSQPSLSSLADEAARLAGSTPPRGLTADGSDRLVQTRSPVTTPVSSPRLPPVPSNSFHFQADCKCLRNHPDKFYQYFKAIDPNQLPRLLGEALDAQILMQILSTLQDKYNAEDDAFPVLASLVHVKRFNMTVMFLSAKEKLVVSAIFEHVKMSGQHNAAEVDNLHTKYS